MRALHDFEFLYTQDHKLDLNSTARVPLKDLVNTVMVKQVEEFGRVRNGCRE